MTSDRKPGPAQLNAGTVHQVGLHQNQEYNFTLPQTAYFKMITRFTEITPKDLQILQGISTYKAAWRAVVGIRDSFDSSVLLLCHLAQYWSVPEAELIASLSGKKSA